MNQAAKKQIGILLAAGLIALGGTGCSQTASSEKAETRTKVVEQTTATAKKEQTQQPAAESGEQTPTIEEDSGIPYTNEEFGFTLVLPDVWYKAYTVENIKLDNGGTNVNFISKKASSFGGVVFQISVWPEDYWDGSRQEIEEQIPITELGRQDGSAYLLLHPADVQYDPADDEASDTYKALADTLPRIEQSFELTGGNGEK
ncbi:hypothetical protein QWJ34_16970 [Saccharibacillus sp. CPCC 101409]|uniref:hypothetical protein n=1 Tax=Saccharibacillus sp. CPCC 101409 TaxID=3058041 RepID=UPI0026729B8F|nr:hypothetical protein [Saccharibacillus sp. CPCC 101409]MDO3411461.1 hypothetical protein [Saccharibacillus sp. CPCC 101409]